MPFLGQNGKGSDDKGLFNGKGWRCIFVERDVGKGSIDSSGVGKEEAFNPCGCNGAVVDAEGVNFSGELFRCFSVGSVSEAEGGGHSLPKIGSPGDGSA